MSDFKGGQCEQAVGGSDVTLGDTFLALHSGISRFRCSVLLEAASLMPGRTGGGRLEFIKCSS